MNFLEIFIQAFDSLKSNKLRSILTMIGIIMGVFSVITIMALGNAFESYVEGQFEKLGANIVTITYKDSSARSEAPLTMDDIKTVKKVIPEIKNISTSLSWFGSIRVGSKTRESYLICVASQYENFQVSDILHGRFINDIDVSARSNVAVVQESFAQQYFKRSDIVGESIEYDAGYAGKLKFRVVGVLKSAGDLMGSITESDMYPAQVIIPITTAQGIYGIQEIDSIMFSVVEKNKLKEIGSRVVKALEFKKNRTGVYMTQNTADNQKMFSDMLSKISMFLLVIAVITLLVGGIGIVNILLVSVTERIREIGIRKALGARKSDIIIQFITESIMMTGISGLIGIIIGLVLGAIISSLIKIPPAVDMQVVCIAFFGSVALGLIFGVYPAKKAADLDPIESLRYE